MNDAPFWAGYSTEFADYYDIDIREIIDGERKNDINKETKETLTKVAEYADQNKLQLKKKRAGTYTAALILLIFCTVWRYRRIGMSPQGKCPIKATTVGKRYVN